MSSYIGPLTSTIIEGISNEMTKDETQEKIYRNILTPFLCKINRKYAPYFMFLILLFMIIIILLVTIVILVSRHRCTVPN